MSIGQAYKEFLSEKEQEVLNIACEVLIDETLTDLERVQEPKNVDDTILGTYLPQRYLHKYTPIFFKKFAVCLITVTWKLAQVKPWRFASLAEELATWVIIQEAQRLLDEEEDAGVEDNLQRFTDIVFEDLDFQFLYEDAYDGIDETEAAEKMGMSSLAFDDWFKPFADDPERIVHPYVSE